MVGARRVAVAAMLLATAGTSSCIGRGAFECATHEECDDGPNGRCEANAHCSYADTSCASGRRWGDFAGNGLAAQCLEDAVGGTSSADTGSSGGPGLCGNGELDPGEECDDDNPVNGDGCNNDCVASGSLLWSDVWDGPTGGDDKGFGVAVAPDGAFAVVGYTTVASGIRAALVLFYASEGEEPEAELIERATESSLRTATYDDAGRLVVGGFEGLAQGSGAFLRFYAADRSPALTWRYTIVDGKDEGISDVALSADADVFAVGIMGEGMGHGQWVARINPADDGQVMWENVEFVRMEKIGDLPRLALDAESRIAVAAHHDAGGLVGTAARWDHDGSRSWEAEIPESGARGRGSAVAWQRGEVFAGGFRESGGQEDGFISRLAGADGAAIGDPIVVVGNESGRDQVSTIVALPDGDLATAGWKAHDASDHVWVARFAPDGTPRWERLVGLSPGTDRAFDLELAEDGSLVVAGYTETDGAEPDVFVLRFAP